MKTFTQFLEEKKKLTMMLNIGGEPEIVEKSKKSKKLQRKLDIGGEPTIVGDVRKEKKKKHG